MMQRWAWRALGVVVLLLCLSVSQVIAQARLNKAYLQALHSIDINVIPLNVAELIGIFHRQKYDVTEALSALSSIASIAPNAHLEKTLAVLFAVSGHAEQAERLLEKIPAERDAQVTLAIVYGQQRRFDDAKNLLRQVQNAPLILAANGEAAYWAGRRSEALALLSLAVALDNGQNNLGAQIFEHLAYLYADQSDYTNAAKYATLWVAAAPHNLEARLVLAGYNLGLQRTEEAFAVLQQVEAMGGRTHRNFPALLGQAYDQRGDLTRAIPLYREALSQNPDAPYVAWYLGNALFRAGQLSESKIYLQQAAESPYAGLRQSATILLEKIAKMEAR